MARSVDGFDYRVLEVAFLRLRETLEQAGSFDDAGLKAIAEDQRLQEDLAWFREARQVAWRAGLSRYERIRDPRRRKAVETRIRREVSAAAQAPAD
jgi:hypothetical protein